MDCPHRVWAVFRACYQVVCRVGDFVCLVIVCMGLYMVGLAYDIGWCQCTVVCSIGQLSYHQLVRTCAQHLASQQAFRAVQSLFSRTPAALVPGCHFSMTVGSSCESKVHVPCGDKSINATSDPLWLHCIYMM